MRGICDQPIGVRVASTLCELATMMEVGIDRHSASHTDQTGPSASQAELEDVVPGELQPTEADETTGEMPIEELAKSIYQLTEKALELLRSQSRIAVHNHKKANLLWLDELTETQANAVIAVRQLCDETPEGITLKRLAERLGVTPAGASIMVDLLVKKKMLKRTKSKEDRRAVVIRLTPDTAHLFDVSEHSLLNSLIELEKTMGMGGLRNWRETLVNAVIGLQAVVKGSGHMWESAGGISESSPNVP